MEVQPRTEVGVSVDTRLQGHVLRVERKRIVVDLHENQRGRFVRIVEEVSRHHNAVVCPLVGLEELRDTLNKIIEFSKTLPPDS